MSTEARINRQIIRGLEFPCSPFFTREKIEAALDYSPRDDDIIISTYPKTGTTWVQYIVYEILNDGKIPPSQEEMRGIIPFMEEGGTEIIPNCQTPECSSFTCLMI
ncbi:sulfotransferase 1 family member D1 [Caerostris darwini]|uniref:Sulfotransferase 1 family member D1 n=1 Tax=Caerostris darwini TaxID=1538125 RepID=A0AAV4RT53_9ARAC|nr:sulfotransferase 1 family member D1 [Caerostris darwini]